MNSERRGEKERESVEIELGEESGEGGERAGRAAKGRNIGRDREREGKANQERRERYI